MYKLYTSLIAKRLSTWLERNDLLAPNQKGYRGFDGTTENNFVLDQMIAKAKRLKKDIYILLHDLKNAFDSVPHAVIHRAFEAAGVGDMFGAILKYIYAGNITQLLTANGLSDDIEIKLGIKQGCSLSGVVFNLVISLIFIAIQNLREELHGLGYADDTAVFELTLKALQDTLDRIGLELNIDKCKSIHIGPSKASCGDGKVFIGGAEVPQLQTFEATEHLGKPFGFRLFPDENKIYKFLETATRVLTSNLAPWQRLDAIKRSSSRP